MAKSEGAAKQLGMFNTEHARKCKKTMEECKLCQRNQEIAIRLTLSTLNKILENPQAPKARISLASLAIENLIDRTKHSSKRANRDSIVSMKLLKEYERMGGTL